MPIFDELKPPSKCEHCGLTPHRTNGRDVVDHDELCLVIQALKQDIQWLRADVKELRDKLASTFEEDMGR